MKLPAQQKRLFWFAPLDRDRRTGRRYGWRWFTRRGAIHPSSRHDAEDRGLVPSDAELRYSRNQPALGLSFALLGLGLLMARGDLGHIVGAAACCATGLYLMAITVVHARAARVVRWKLSARCSACGYDLHGLGPGRCPECGEPFHAGERRRLPQPDADDQRVDE